MLQIASLTPWVRKLARGPNISFVHQRPQKPTTTPRVLDRKPQVCCITFHFVDIFLTFLFWNSYQRIHDHPKQFVRGLSDKATLWLWLKVSRVLFFVPSTTNYHPDALMPALPI